MERDQRVKARKTANGGRFSAHGNEAHIYGNILTEIMLLKYKHLNAIKFDEEWCEDCVVKINHNGIRVIRDTCDGCSLRTKCVHYEFTLVECCNSAEVEAVDRARGLYVR